jgi:phosphoglycerol transferase MdoB-like AlkP superfamily enzyme
MLAAAQIAASPEGQKTIRGVLGAAGKIFVVLVGLVLILIAVFFVKTLWRRIVLGAVGAILGIGIFFYGRKSQSMNYAGMMPYMQQYQQYPMLGPPM